MMEEMLFRFFMASSGFLMFGFVLLGVDMARDEMRWGWPQYFRDWVWLVMGILGGLSLTGLGIMLILVAISPGGLG